MTDNLRTITGKVSEWIAVLRDMVPEFGDYALCLVLQSLDGEPLSVAAVLRELERLPAEQDSFSLYSASPWRTLPDDKRLGFVGPGVEGDVPRN